MKQAKFFSSIMVNVLILAFGLSGQTPTSRDSSAAIAGPLPQAIGGVPTIFNSFDVPGGAITNPASINLLGAIAGTYFDSSFVAHGFVRSPEGVVSTFDAPDASRTLGGAINDFGIIAGSFFDGKQAAHVFVRLNDCGARNQAACTIETIDVPGAVGGRRTGTIFGGLNNAGIIVGRYTDSQDVSHGFLRAANGIITKFDVPGEMGGTFPVSINNEGAVTGYFGSQGSAGPVYSGFLRTPDGKFTTFSSSAYPNLYPQTISDTGAIIGTVGDRSGNSRGFVRDANGSLKIFDAGGYSSSSCCVVTGPNNINTFGTIIGDYFDMADVYHGFQRNSDGTIKVFQVPGAGTAAYQGTTPVAINLDGAITGNYVDANGLVHGFYLFQPNNQ